MIAKYLEALKNNRKLTNKQIAEMSGVSPATIQRVLAEKGESSFDTVSRIVRGLGGSLDELAGISKPESEELQELRDRISEQEAVIQAMTQQVNAFDATLAAITSSYQDMIAEKEKANDYLKRIIRFLGIALAVILVFIMLVVGIDILNGAIGWSRS